MYRIGYYGLSEDEAAKWQAIRDYSGHLFVALNSEHSMLMKVLAQTVCQNVLSGTRLSTVQPMSMSYHIERCGRKDIQVIPLYAASQ